MANNKEIMLEALEQLGGFANSSNELRVKAVELGMTDPKNIAARIRLLLHQGLITATRKTPTGRYSRIRLADRPENTQAKYISRSWPTVYTNPEPLEPPTDLFDIAEAKYFRAIVDEVIKRDIHLFISIVKEIG